MQRDSLSIVGILIDPTKVLSEDLSQLFWRLGICILIGVLVGAEREHSKKEGRIFAGIRTFPLISMMGFLSAMISTFTSPLVFVVSTLAFVLLVIAAYIMFALEGRRGVTTDMAGILVFLLGALVYWHFIVFSVAVAVVITALLSLQPQLNQITKKIVEEDIYAILKFATITIIILPILPDKTFDPLNVLNPRQIWYMVILIAGISFTGYVLIKFTRADRAIPLTGLLGGIVSSTAVSLTFSQKSKESLGLERHYATAIILASTVMLPRTLLESFVISQSLFFTLLLPISILLIAGILTSLFLWRRSLQQQASGSVEVSNPFKLMTAIKFGLIFAVILFISKASQTYLGTNGIYYACILGGLTDVSAVTLSMANLTQSSVPTNVASTGIIMAILANTVMKFGICFFIGSPLFRKYIAYSYGIIFLVGILIILFLL
jgi:uncharacterized membrane protein (DUF4010 family)